MLPRDAAPGADAVPAPGSAPAEGAALTHGAATAGGAASPPATVQAGTKGMRNYVVEGWRLGGVALRFVIDHRVLRAYVLAAAGLMVLAAASVGGVVVILRNRFGVFDAVLSSLALSYAWAVIGTAASVGLASLVAGTLDGRPVKPSDGWRLIVRRRGTIFTWSVLELLVGLPARMAGRFAIEQLFVILLGFGWGLLSFFAIPAIALSTTSARSAARRSLHLVRQRWGGAVYGTVYVWVRALVTVGLPGALLVGLGAVFVELNHEVLGAVFVALGAGTLAATYLLAIAARAVVAVVLYRYADSGATSDVFRAEMLERALRPPSAAVARVAAKLDGKRIRRLRERLLGPEQ